MDHWYRHDRFTIGDSYFDADGLFELEYLGIVIARLARQLIGGRADELDTDSDTEPVMLFQVVGDDGIARSDNQVVYYAHTKSDADRGYHFIKIADAAMHGHRQIGRLTDARPGSRPGRHVELDQQSDLQDDRTWGSD